VPRDFAVLADTSCQMLIMNKKLFDVVCSDYYHVYQRLKETATERFELNRRAMSDVIEIADRMYNRGQTVNTVGLEFALKRQT
jgi:hypothetical protein